jgi:hypothetical protein
VKGIGENSAIDNVELDNLDDIKDDGNNIQKKV